MQSFKKLTLRRWRQFDDLELDLTPHLCVLTGPNGSGKTTVLNVLGKHFGWNLQFLTASFLSEKQRKRLYADAWDAFSADTPQANAVGTITYSNDVVSQLTVPTQDNSRYELRFANQQTVVGLHIPSHRPPPSHHQVVQIPIDPKSTQQHYTQYQNILFATYGESPRKNPASAMKETLIAFAVFGEGNAAVQRNEEYHEVFAAFQEILGKLLPDHIGFRSIEIRTPDVILKTASGDFPLEAMSGGLNALFGIAWQIHTYPPGACAFSNVSVPFFIRLYLYSPYFFFSLFSSLFTCPDPADPLLTIYVDRSAPLRACLRIDSPEQSRREAAAPQTLRRAARSAIRTL